jgi:hypothetical protein
MGDVGIMGMHVPGMSWREIRDSAVLAEELSVAKKTWENFVARIIRLYEREPREDASSRLGEYVQQWVRWVRVGRGLNATPTVLSVR